MSQKSVVIGGGFAGLSAACYLAKAGHQVTLLEQHKQWGGRARQYKEQGYTFDMGPSWYWMPDVFDRFFADFGKKTSDYYKLHLLDPAYSVYFEDGKVEMPATAQETIALFERMEAGAGAKLQKFLDDGAYKYEVGINDLVRKPGRSLLEFADMRVLKGLFQLDLLRNIRSVINQNFKNPQLRQLMEFPVLFLGAVPQNTPALYSLMNYADRVLGTWYPEGGMYSVVRAMVSLAEELGVSLKLEHEVTGFSFDGANITAVNTNKGAFEANYVVGGADYAFIDQHLLPPDKRHYTPKYWATRKMAPSSILYYVGLDRKIDLPHHALFFDAHFDTHADAIYTNPRWPKKPMFYVSAASQTDASVAPEGCENLVILIPTAPGLEDTDEVLDRYFDLVSERLLEHIGVDIRQHLVMKKSYAYRDFVKDYNAHLGNAYGLANTLDQTAIFKPKLKAKKVRNLYYTGQLTTPGPGVPPCLISGEVVAHEIAKEIIR
jgi:phytoene desaturase